jgi:CHASE2 domain-containing sensor protein
MKGLISRLAVLFWVGYMGVVLGSMLSRINFDLWGIVIFILGLIFGSLIVLLLGWVLALLVNVVFNGPEGFILDLVWVTLIYWFGFFVGMFFRVV